jgi:hypothetical protein
MYLVIVASGAILLVIGVVLWLVAGRFTTPGASDRAHAVAIGIAAFGIPAVLIGVIGSLVSR